METREILRKVLADELGHLEHIDDLLATEHNLERGVRIDIAFVLRILELVLLDVCPKLLDDFATRMRTFANHRSECLADLHRFHER